METSIWFGVRGAQLFNRGHLRHGQNPLRIISGLDGILIRGLLGRLDQSVHRCWSVERSWKMEGQHEPRRSRVQEQLKLEYSPGPPDPPPPRPVLGFQANVPRRSCVLAGIWVLCGSGVGVSLQRLLAHLSSNGWGFVQEAKASGRQGRSKLP